MVLCLSSLHHVIRAALLDLVIIGLWAAKCPWYPEQICFVTDWIQRNNTLGCLLKLLANVAHQFGSVILNFSGQQPPISNSQFCSSVGSGHNPTANALLSLALATVNFGYCNSLDMPGMDRPFLWYPMIIPSSNSESSELHGVLHATACVVVSQKLFNGDDRDVNQDRRYRCLRYVL